MLDESALLLEKIKRLECFVGSDAEQLCEACASVAKIRQETKGGV